MISKKNRGLLLRGVITLAITFMIASCAGGGGESGNVVTQYYDAVSAGDADAAAALFAEDAMVVIPSGNTLTGLDDITSSFIPYDLENMERVDFQSEFTESDGKVLWTQEYVQKDGFSFVSNCEIILENGKIIEWRFN